MATQPQHHPRQVPPIRMPSGHFGQTADRIWYEPSQWRAMLGATVKAKRERLAEEEAGRSRNYRDQANGNAAKFVTKGPGNREERRSVDPRVIANRLLYGTGPKPARR